MLCEALKIALSKLKQRGADVKIFLTIYDKGCTEILNKLKDQYLVNIENINFTSLRELCRYLNCYWDYVEPQETISSVVMSLTNKYRNSMVILLCDEVFSGKSADWSNIVTSHNVTWMLAVNPKTSGGAANSKISPPNSEYVISQQLLINYRNCYQIR